MNETGTDAAFNIAAINDMLPFERFADYIEKEIHLAKEGEPGLGHPQYAVPLYEVLLGPRELGALVGTLEPGTYAIACGRVYRRLGQLRPAGALGPVEIEG